MASERFKVFIGDLPPQEEKPEYTKKEKAKNFWYYNKWLILGGIAAVLVIIGTIVSVVTKVKPDYTFAIISASYLPDTLPTALENALTPYVDDRNNDGKVTVQFNQYNLGFTEADLNADPNTRMANITRLMGDLQTNESMIFFLEDVKGVQETQGFLAYNDATYPMEGDEVDYSRMGVKWTDSDELKNLEIDNIEIMSMSEEPQFIDGHKIMNEFSMALRYFDVDKKPDSDATKYYYECLELFTELAK